MVLPAMCALTLTTGKHCYFALFVCVAPFGAPSNSGNFEDLSGDNFTPGTTLGGASGPKRDKKVYFEYAKTNWEADQVWVEIYFEWRGLCLLLLFSSSVQIRWLRF